jgi:hypothetical protein
MLTWYANMFPQTPCCLYNRHLCYAAQVSRSVMPVHTHWYILQNFRAGNWMPILWWSSSCFQNIRPHTISYSPKSFQCETSFSLTLIVLDPPSQYGMTECVSTSKIDILQHGSYVGEDIYIYMHYILCVCVSVYRLPQEERSVFSKVMLSVILSKKSVYVHMSYSGQFLR